MSVVEENVKDEPILEETETHEKEQPQPKDEPESVESVEPVDAEQELEPPQPYAVESTPHGVVVADPETQQQQQQPPLLSPQTEIEAEAVTETETETAGEAETAGVGEEETDDVVVVPLVDVSQTSSSSSPLTPPSPSSPSVPQPSNSEKDSMAMSVNLENHSPPQTAAESDGVMNGDGDLLLQDRWTLYYNAPKNRSAASQGDPGGWGQGINTVVDFETVQSFWNLFNNLTPPSRLEMGSNFHIFKGDVRPEWEDKYNINGGAWYLKVEKNASPAQYDEAWLHIILAMIGNMLPYPEEVCGVVAVLRPKGVRLELWTKNSSLAEIRHAIGLEFREIVGNCPYKCIEYKAHKDQIARRGAALEELYPQ